MAETEDHNFAAQLAQLESGELGELTVHPEDFMEFQAAYMNFDKRKRIIGTAGQNGIVTYIFERDEQEKDS